MLRIASARQAGMRSPLGGQPLPSFLWTMSQCGGNQRSKTRLPNRIGVGELLKGEGTATFDAGARYATVGPGAPSERSSP